MTALDRVGNLMMDAADLLAGGEQPDPRAWEHLLIYAPKEALERRLKYIITESPQHSQALKG